MLIASPPPNSSSYTEILQEEATFTPSTLDMSGVNHDNDLARRKRDNERKCNLTNEQREQKNASSRACHQKKSDELTVEGRETKNKKYA